MAALVLRALVVALVRLLVALSCQTGMPAFSCQSASPYLPFSRHSRVAPPGSVSLSSTSRPCVTVKSSSAEYAGWRSPCTLTLSRGMSPVPILMICVVGGYTSFQRSRTA